MRRIKSAQITHIALCPRGKNRMPVLYKADDSTAQFETLIRASDDAGELTAVVWTPDVPDVDGDFADRSVVKQMAYGFNRDHRQLDLRHDGKTLDKSRAYVAENFIVAKGDERFADWKDYDGTPVNLEGAWAVVIKIDDPELRRAYRNGAWNGVSMFGPAVMETVSKTADERVFERMTQGVKQMNPEQMLALAKSITDGVTQGIANLLKSQSDAAEAARVAKEAADKAAAPKAPTAPVFQGDMASKEDREAFLLEVRAFELNKAIAEGKSASEIAELFKALDEVEPSDEAAGIKKSDAPEVKELKRKLAKAEKRTNQTVTKETVRASGDPDELSKEEQDFNQTVIDMVNESRGFAKSKA